MTNIAVIENKISAIRKYLDLLKAYLPHTVDQIKTNVTVRGAIERYLYLATQATIDLAEAMIAYRRLRKPTIYSEAVAHDYEKIDYNIVYDILHHRLGDIEDFTKIVEQGLT